MVRFSDKKYRRTRRLVHYGSGCIVTMRRGSYDDRDFILQIDSND